MQLNYYEGSCYQRGNGEWNMFVSSLVTEDDWDVVKTYSLSEVWASLTYGRRHPAELVDENEGQIKESLRLLTFFWLSEADLKFGQIHFI